MKFVAKLENGQTLTVDKAFWTGLTKVKLDHKLVGTFKWKNKKPVKIVFKDNSEHQLEIKQLYVDPLPITLIDGKDVFADQRLGPVENLVVRFPFLLICFMGAVPALIGVSSVYLNFFIARSKILEPAVKYYLYAAIPALGVIIIIGVNAIAWNSTKVKVPHYESFNQEQGPSSWDAKSRSAKSVEQEVLGR